jgi:hypothetical protein
MSFAKALGTVIDINAAIPIKANPIFIATIGLCLVCIDAPDTCGSTNGDMADSRTNVAYHGSYSTNDNQDRSRRGVHVRGCSKCVVPILHYHQVMLSYLTTLCFRHRHLHHYRLAPSRDLPCCLRMHNVSLCLPSLSRPVLSNQS